MTDGKSQPPPRNSNTISSSSRLAPPPPYSEDIERGVNETSPLYPSRLPFFHFFAHSFHNPVLQQILLSTQFQGNLRSESMIEIFYLNSLRIPSRLALINQHQHRHLGVSQYFFILQYLIIIGSKTLRTILLFSILAIVFTLYLHERTKNQFVLDGLTWIELTPSSRCLRYSTANILLC
ncbi:hypothetical protein EV421DRAFT_402093 [Armillaria borealis]|uniref:Uncharacterized protein n=1 Tax=Armillaria borealis TaxID=47425 RepID=A0AA39IT25_9AGAR|nr:hypothetical protein EV421DRAFT_402093 [Armillaria borealis]